MNQSGEKTKAKSCLACNIKKVPSRIRNPGTTIKCQVQKRRASLVEVAEEEEEILEAALGQRKLLAMKEDQWKLGVQQIKLEEIQMKVDFGPWILEKDPAERKKLLELKQTGLKKKPYKSSYKQWEAEREKIVEKWEKMKEKKKELGLEVDEEPEPESTELEGEETCHDLLHL